LKPFKIITVELDAGPSQRHMMRVVHTNLLPDLIKGADEVTGEGYLNASVCQRLFLSNLHPYSERVYTRKGKLTAKVVDTWYDATDEGATFFFESTKLEASLPTPRDRPSLSWYIGYDSAKLQYLAGIVKEVCFGKKRKLLIFIDWPFNLWLVYMFLQGVLGIECLTIQADHTNTERGEIEDMFNDPHHPAKVLIASIRTTGTALNLQDQCSDVVLLDLPPNENLKIQCLGRLYRVGQAFLVTMWILTLNGSYDQMQQARAARKYLAQIAGQAGIQIDQKHVEATLAARKVLGLGFKDLCSPKANKKGFKDSLLQPTCRRLYREQFGLRSDRHNWHSKKDLRAKDFLPGEIREGEAYSGPDDKFAGM
jgi:hypothetical protein